MKNTPLPISLYNALFSSLKDCVAIYKAENNGENFSFVDLNSAAEISESLKKETILGKLVTDVFPGVIEFGLLKIFQDVYKNNSKIHFPMAFYADDRISGWRENYVYKLDNEHIVAIYSDITQEKQSEADLKLAATFFENSLEGIIITNKEGIILKANKAFLIMSGYSAEEIIGKHANILKSKVHPEVFYSDMKEALNNEGIWEGEIWDRKKNGDSFAAFLSINAVYDEDNKIKQFIGIYLDVTENKRTQEKIQHLVYFDTLTGLPNRAQLEVEIVKQIKLAERKKQSFSLLMLDLDNFKHINDFYGHHIGDLILIEVAKKINTVLRQTDIFARLGGDEFMIISDNHLSNEQARLSQRILDVFEHPFLIDEIELSLSCSIGVASYPKDGNSKNTLFKNADFAMYEAKKNGRNRYHFYSSHHLADSSRRMQIDSKLRAAIKSEAFEIYLQPKVCVYSSQLIGAEALIRWHDPLLGFVSPVEFIPYAEESGLICTIGDIVLKKTFLIIKELEEKNHDLKVSINISSAQLEEESFTDKVEGFLKQYQCDPNMIEFEITESKIMHNVEQNIITLQQIKNLGIQISIDDFGTGYSSMNYLKRLPIDIIKIDKSFIDEIVDDKDSKVIVQGILSLAKALSLKTIAEGVEIQAQEDFLKDNQCDFIQGYLHSKPLNKNHFFGFIGENKKKFPLSH